MRCKESENRIVLQLLKNKNGRTVSRERLGLIPKGQVHELEGPGHRFVRYTDDMMIFCRSKKAAQRTLENILPFIEGKLFLKVNREKTQVAYIRQVKYLGYSFYVYKGEGRLRVHPNSVRKIKDRIREITGRSNGMGIEERKTRLNLVIRGWVNYFKLADMKSLIEDMDSWTRSRIRMVTWKRWKKIWTRFENLKRAGLDKERAWMWAKGLKQFLCMGAGSKFSVKLFSMIFVN